MRLHLTSARQTARAAAARLVARDAAGPPTGSPLATASFLRPPAGQLLAAHQLPAAC